MGNIICKNFKLLLSPKENNKQVICISEQKEKKKYISDTSLGRLPRVIPLPENAVPLGDKKSRELELLEASQQRNNEATKLSGNEVSLQKRNGSVTRKHSFLWNKIKFNKVPQTSTEFLPELKVPFEQFHLPNRFYLEHKTRLSKNEKILYKYLQIKNKNLRNFNNSLMMRICDLLNEKQLLEYKIHTLIN